MGGGKGKKTDLREPLDPSGEASGDAPPPVVGGPPPAQYGQPPAANYAPPQPQPQQPHQPQQPQQQYYPQAGGMGQGQQVSHQTPQNVNATPHWNPSVGGPTHGQFYHCPRCQFEGMWIHRKTYSDEAWFSFICLVIFFFPLAWIPFVIDKWAMFEMMCPQCGYMYKWKGSDYGYSYRRF